MKQILTVAAITFGLGSPLVAAEAGAVSWSNSVEAAWQTAGALDRPMLVFVTRAGCLPCARMKTTTFVDGRVTRLINDRFVAIVVDGSQPTPLLKDLMVHAVPATFVISPDAVILARIEGFLPPEALAARLSEFAAKPQRQPRSF